MHRVVIIGGGFAGLEAAKGLGSSQAQVTLVDRCNFHLFQPLLYQVATGSLSGANIATPLRHLLRRHCNILVRLDDVTGFDIANRRVLLAGGELAYDSLIVAAGSRQDYFKHPEWEEHAPGLKTLEDALAVRAQLFRAFEQAEHTADPDERAALLTFVIAGGGPTSVEMAGALSEIAHHSLRGEFRNIDPASSRIVLVEAGERVLGQFSESSSAHAAEALTHRGIELRLRTFVTGIDSGGVDLSGPDGPQRIAARTVFWGAGVAGSPLGSALTKATGLSLGKGSRVTVEQDCSLPGHRDIFVIGDLAAFTQDGALLPGVAQVAVQQGSFVAKLVLRTLRGGLRPVFRYRSKGTMATIGKREAVVEVGSLHVRGRTAWFAWLFLHLIKLVRSENRLLVMIQWAWYYVTWKRSARLTTAVPRVGSSLDS